MIIGSLFSGIGGFELGLQRGLGSASVAWQVELDPWCRQVLARHWPDAARHDDVRAVGAHNLTPVDVLCGGFPCQDISTAGAGAGLAGARSGLWFEMLRIVNELRPKYVVAENVAALRTRGLPVVLAGLREAGYVSSWAIISAADLGAPHQRRRLWIVAYRRDAEPVTVPAPGGVRDDVWPRGGDPEPWERGEPRWVNRAGADRLPRLHALGNAIVPQVPELIGHAIAGRSDALTMRPAARSKQWYTPTAHNAKENGSPAEYTIHTPTLTAQVIGDPTQRGTLSPRWVELLMGYPLDWTTP